MFSSRSNSFFCLLIAWILLGLAPFFSSLRAQEHDEFVFRSIEKIYAQQLDPWKKKQESGRILTWQEKKQLDVLYFDTLARIEVLEKIEERGQNISTQFLNYLENYYLKELRHFYEFWHMPMAAENFEEVQRKQREQMRPLEQQLVAANKQMMLEQPQLKRILQLMSLSRSETLGAGRIGELNPDGTRASEHPEYTKRIQESALEGLLTVLKQTELVDGKSPPLTIEQLQSFHTFLLGDAAHVSSHPGKINDIVFVGKDGRHTHIREYLKEFESKLQTLHPSAVSAIEVYGDFLHLHPFGDSNGRVAEVVKQWVLEKAQLPPLLTREKTAVENYYFQKMFGSGLVGGDVNEMMSETLHFMQTWNNLLGEGQKIEQVRLAGDNILALVRGADGKIKIYLCKRIYTVEEKEELPPIEGSMVMAMVAPSAALVRVSDTGWGQYRDLVPKEILSVPRMGHVQMHYAFYELPITKVAEGKINLEFAFYYVHPNGHTVWFNNYERNYSASFNLKN